MKHEFRVIKQLLSSFTFLLLINSCSSLSRITTLELDPNKNSNSITQIGKYHIESASWNNHSANTFSDSINNNFMFAFATKFPNPLLFAGPPYLSIIPNFYYYGYKFFAKKDFNFFVDFAFKSIKSPITLDLSNIKFYELSNNEEIQVDTIKYLHYYKFGVSESDLARTTWIQEKPIPNRIISKQVIVVDSISYLRFNLKTSTYYIDDGIIIKFGDKFISNDTTKVKDIYLIRNDKFNYNPLVPFGS